MSELTRDDCIRYAKESVNVSALTSLRDDIALVALLGMISNPHSRASGKIGDQFVIDFATDSYRFADAMLAARNQ